MMEGVLKKEDVSQAKVAEIFLREVQKYVGTLLRDGFAENPLSPPTLDKKQVEMKIPLDQDAITMKDQVGRMSPEQHKIVQEQVDLMIRYKIVEETVSPWGAQVVWLKRKMESGDSVSIISI
jgi:hypothetical protein